MTSFIAWVGVDSRGTSSINIATDSRITWKVEGIKHWDMARKTFSCTASADIFGYVNDVMFPSMVLGQLVNTIDQGEIFNQFTASEERFKIVVANIKNSYKNYPDILKESFSIFHASRDGEGMGSRFELRILNWDKERKEWTEKQLDMPKVSSAIIVDGSGKQAVFKWAKRWDSSSQGGTSRAIFSSFCNAVYSGEDKFTSGAPQLVSLYRKGSGKIIGFVDGNKRYLVGTELTNEPKITFKNIEWRNRYFERCEEYGNLLPGTQKHHVPKGLAST